MGLHCDFIWGLVGFLTILVVGELGREVIGVSVNPSENENGNGLNGVRIQSNCGSALVLPLVESKRHGHVVDRRFERRGRGLVEDARMVLHDDLLTKGYYTSRVFIGTPAQEFALIVDTGSTVTYVPCSSCTHCGHHQDPRFKPDNSSSYQTVSCNSPDCITKMCDARVHQCKYERVYAEMSSSKGVLGKDLLGFGNGSRLQPHPLLFGCETAETGDLYLQHADGIMGLGRGPLSIVDQLVGTGAMEDSFSLCYGGMDEGGGSMVLGAIPPPPAMVFAKSDPNRSNYYNLELSEIQVQGVSLNVPSEVFNGRLGTVLDSGTTYAYLPDKAFDAFKDAITQQLGSLQAVPGPDPSYPDVCFAGAGSDSKALGKHFPPVDFVFSGNQKVFLAPENYLFKHTKVPGAYCLGFFKNQDATTLLGGIVVRNTLVTYDRANHQIGFFKTNCTNLWSILPAEPPLAPPPPPVNESSPIESPASLPEDKQDFGSIELLIELDGNFTTILNQTLLFKSSMASELAISSSQISIEDIKEDGEHVVVRCIISPASSQLFSSSAAKALAARLEDHTVKLPEIFGAYRLRSWKGLPPSKWAWIHSDRAKMGAMIAILVGVVVLLAVIASLVYWYFFKYRNRGQIKYENLEVAETNEEETWIGDEQL
ncbi:protein ASPARTIC PROTEASE IN GUARD CELL 1 isoform X2 [Physcomitrium patens]|uniref:Peptidase A1 domain-containing protein n=1 Tax=Physcomitrium patens TaxID=3218 RepID=A0A2K1L759_PHYPA|nr:protein ASPARTIC PROTEASE IN GUARD CELL 1-like isoform X2 [Physcomitrium patens]PNR61876.1 hypothetical protein PHYPA_000300 [Physcomitrium patens]|eukprot:XP_024392664.1 protein ASPARTIC PROTEASE IN GUARD CELL 1-like isoform X2 [Physcomitrella patens]